MADHIQGPGSIGRTARLGWRSRWTRRNVTAATLLARSAAPVIAAAA